MTAAEEALFGIDKLNVPRSDIPAVTHVDYSARIQTVHEETNPAFHELSRAFKAKTGCSVVVNTSFNVRGEPIVCTPEDAFRCFMGSEIEVLVVGNCFLQEGRPGSGAQARLQERLRARLADSMRARRRLRSPGRSLRPEDRGTCRFPRPDRRDVVVKVGAAAVNFPDILMLAGSYQHKPELPFMPGMEGAGTIHAVGSDVHGLEGRRSRDLRRAAGRLRRICQGHQAGRP